MGRRNYKGWENKGNTQGNSGGQFSGGSSRGGQQSSQNAFSGRGAPTQTRQNAFSALAEPSQSPRFAQNNISQRVSFPAAQRNAFSTAPANAFGGPSSQGHFQSAARQPPAPANNNSAFRRNTNAFNGSNALSNSSNAFSSSGFGGSGAQAQHQGLGGRDNAFARGAATPQSTGFGGGLSQQPLNAFAGTGTQQSFLTPPPRPPQHAAPAFTTNNSRSGFNAFSGSQQPAATPIGFNNSNAFSASTANAFVSHAAAPSLAMQQGSQAPGNAFMGLQTAPLQQSTGRVGFGGGFGGAASASPSASLPAAAAAPPPAPQQPLSDEDRAAWMGAKFEKGMIPELPPPAAVC